MTPLTHDRYCDEVVAQTGMLTESCEALTRRWPCRPVPTGRSRGWRHIGGNLRSVETAVRTGTPVEDPGGRVPDAAGPDGDDPATLEAWLADAAARCAGALMLIRTHLPGHGPGARLADDPGARWCCQRDRLGGIRHGYRYAVLPTDEISASTPASPAALSPVLDRAAWV